MEVFTFLCSNQVTKVGMKALLQAIQSYLPDLITL